MSTEVKSYVPDSLLFSRSPKILSYIKERRPQRVFPNGKTSSWSQQQVIDFEIRSDSLIDLQSAVLNFDIEFDLSNNSRISNALDCVESLRIFYGDTQCEEILNCNDFSNLFLNYSSNETYLKSEGATYLGLTNQFVTASNSGARSYAVPLTLISGFFRSSQSLLPVFGNRIRISLTLASNDKVVSFPADDNEGYKLNNVSVTFDDIVVSEKFRKMVMDAMMSEVGIRIPYTSMTNQTLNIGPVSTFYGRLQFNLSNVLSLHCLVNDSSVKKRKAGEWTLACQSFPLTNFAKAFARVGSTLLCPADGLKGVLEVYQNQNKTISNFNDLMGSGVIDYQTLISPYTKSATISKDKYGLFPLSIDTSKIIANDDMVVNQGISSSGMNEINLEIYKSTGQFSADSVLLTSLVSKRALVFSQGGVLAEF